MKIILLILLSTCTLLKGEYPRYKVRGPPHSPRIPPSKQFSKKWHQQPQHLPRGPVRSRPIPVHMPPSHKIPMGVPQTPSRNAAPPVRTFWKNSQINNIKLAQEKPYPRPPLQEKPFLAAPSINSQELDFHIQTNSIPTTHTNPIKQVGEKGPIHTIPAPNLSLKDKPIVVEEVKYQQNTPFNNVEHNHQYQVTEPPETLVKGKIYRGQQQLIQQQQVLPHQLYQQQLQQQQLLQQQVRIPQDQFIQQELQKHIEIQPQQVYYTTDGITLPQNLNQPSQNVPQNDIYVGTQMNPELYKVVGAAFSQQPQLQQQQSIQIQEPQQNFYQQQKAHQLPNYQALLSHQLFQPDQQNNIRIASDKVGFEPEFHSFNYDEQAHQKSQKGLTKEQLSSLVTAAYSMNSNTPVMESRNSIDPLAQAQLIQNYFDTRADVEENDVEPDAKPSADQKSEPERIKEELLSSSYFSSLPSKEAAERLAHLQAAGKINSNLMKNEQQSNDSKNSDEFEDGIHQDNEDSNENYPENVKDRASEYEEYSQEDENISSEERSTDFGDKVVADRKKN